MKLLKKLLPFATIASVAGIIVPTIVSCKSEKTPVKEYRYTNNSDERINITSSDKFVLNQALVIEYEITDDNYEIDTSASSYIEIGDKKVFLEQCAHDEDYGSGIITVLAKDIKSKTITVALHSKVKEQVDEAYSWDVADADAWEQPDPYTGPSQTTIVTAEYLTDIIANKKRLAYDIAASIVKTEAFTPITAEDYSTINTTIRTITPEDWKMSFTLELIPAQGSSKTYTKLVVDNFTYVISYCYLTQGYTTTWEGWAIEPLALWLNNEALDSATWYLKSDSSWSIKMYDDPDATTPVRAVDNSLTLDELGDFVTDNVASFDLSYQTYYWASPKPTI